MRWFPVGTVDNSGLGCLKRSRDRRLCVEQLESRLLLAADFGDAPTSYSTFLADGGPLHDALGPTLGSLRSEEPDAQPTFAADGDTGDDGVTFALIRAGQL